MRCGGIFTGHFTAECVTEKKVKKSVNFWWSYNKYRTGHTGLLIEPFSSLNVLEIDAADENVKRKNSNEVYLFFT